MSTVKRILGMQSSYLNNVMMKAPHLENLVCDQAQLTPREAGERSILRKKLPAMIQDLPPDCQGETVSKCLKSNSRWV
jgi:hypothetical protein